MNCNEDSKKDQALCKKIITKFQTWNSSFYYAYELWPAAHSKQSLDR